MANKNLIEQMLEHLVNDEQQKAEELFHEYVVAKSRDIYESLIEAEMKDDDDENDDDDVKESSDEDEDDDEKKVDEEFDELAVEADDEMDAMGGDPTDDLESELDAEGDEEGEKDEQELFQDLEAIVDELQAKFDELKGHEEAEGEEGEEDEMKDAFEPELATVREYVEKVPAGHGAEKKGAAEKADHKKSVVDNMKNDMGGTTANILSAKEDTGSKGTAGGLANNKPQDMKTGNINVPGGKAGSAFAKKEPGHGAEKKGAGESADNTGSLFRGRR